MADLQVEGPGTTGNPPVNAITLVYVLFAIAVDRNPDLAWADRVRPAGWRRGNRRRDHRLR